MDRREYPHSLILASASPQRRRLLKNLKIPFQVRPSGAGETSREKNPRKLTMLLARRKALAVARLYPRARVLGADTIVICRGRICLKPKNRADSLKMLKWLNNSRQLVYTGLALAWNGGSKIAGSCVVSRVFTRKLDLIRLKTLAGKHMDKAGGYALQDRADPFIRRVKGPKDNVIGLPLNAVKKLLRLARGSAPY